MANEFNIKNGFISNGDSIVIGGLTATTFSGTTLFVNNTKITNQISGNTSGISSDNMILSSTLFLIQNT